MYDTIYYLITVIYYFWYFYVKKRYFRFRWFISLFLGAFNNFLGQIWFLIWLGIN